MNAKADALREIKRISFTFPAGWNGMGGMRHWECSPGRR